MGVSLGLPTGEVINNSALGWITMMIQFIIIGTPITHVGYEVKRNLDILWIWIWENNKT